jgi:hypothetical protein
MYPYRFPPPYPGIRAFLPELWNGYRRTVAQREEISSGVIVTGLRFLAEGHGSG